jgi:hypothetical protein
MRLFARNATGIDVNDEIRIIDRNTFRDCARTLLSPHIGETHCDEQDINMGKSRISTKQDLA